MSLRIVFVAPFGLKHKTTVWARTLPIAQQLVATGHTATILVPPWDSPEDAEQEEVIEGVRVVQLSVSGGLLPTVRRLLVATAQANPHIIHIVKPRAHAGLVQWWRWQRRGGSKAKLVLDVDDWEQAWNSVNRYNWFVGQFMAWQEEWGIRHADGITTASRWLTDKIATVAPQIPTLYLPNGVTPLTEPPVAQPPEAAQFPKVLFFTRLVEVSPAWLHDFWAVMRELVPTAEFVIAGTPVQPWLAAPFQAAMADMPQVRWTGYVPANELRDLYAQATCAIFPAMSIPLLQAKCSVRLATTLLHGVPVIASAVGEQVSYGAEGAATLVPAEATPSEFAQIVANIIRTDNLQTRHDATSSLLTRYAWSHLTATLPAFYESLL